MCWRLLLIVRQIQLPMDIANVQRELSSFIARHRASFEQMEQKESQVLELAALAIASEHYKRKGYTVSPRNLWNGSFRIKLGARGYRSNFPWFEVVDRSKKFE